MKYSLLLLCVLMSGCAAKLLSADDKKVVVQSTPREMVSAQDLADAECAKRGNRARLTGKISSDQYVYDCIR